jgi:RHS repeat-associated protein
MVMINTKYTIEPHVNGGSPIMADGNVIFNDMLGSSLGTVENGTFKEIGRTSFGDQLSNSSTPELSNFSNDFFTGKPAVAGLGYSFLFRNYRADVSKWQTSDPLGYPDGWNNFAYCGNNGTSSLDTMGLYTNAQKAVLSLGGIYIARAIFAGTSPFIGIPANNALKHFFLPPSFGEALGGAPGIQAAIDTIIEDLSPCSLSPGIYQYPPIPLNIDIGDGLFEAINIGNLTVKPTLVVFPGDGETYRSHWTLMLICTYHDYVDWNSYSELVAEGAIKQKYNLLHIFPHVPEMLADMIFDKTLGAAFHFTTTWTTRKEGSCPE